MDNEVIILAQGPAQVPRRRPGGPGNLIPWTQPLPACNGVPIIRRTIKQVQRLGADRPTLVAWDGVNAAVNANLVWFQLPEPGNSALKGIARYLELREQQGRRYASTIVLLGDVVYSWACLEAIFRMSRTYGFVGTSGLSPNIGELWGVAWSREFEDRMLSNLRDALLRHPLGDEYHAQQLRRWVSGWKRGDMLDHVAKLTRTGAYMPIDDYTHDIDQPSDLVMLPELSKAAADDDAKHGISWTENKEASMQGT